MKCKILKINSHGCWFKGNQKKNKKYMINCKRKQGIIPNFWLILLKKIYKSFKNNKNKIRNFKH